MKNLKFLILLLTLLAFSKAFASQSMRRCMLLPIRDNIGGAVAYKVFEELEKYLKRSDWCYYQTNSEILDILGNYKNELDKHLEDKNVLKLLSEKTNTGSLIKIKITNRKRGTSLDFKVFGENGEDVYFSESADLKTDEIVIIVQTLQNWLEEYEKRIPYDSRVIGVLGNQFTLDLGKQGGVGPGDILIIKRPIRKKKHPLLKEIVDWESEKIGEGKVFHVAKSQSQGKITRYEGKERLEVDDWIVLKDNETADVVKVEKFEKDSEYEFGKMGKFGLFFHLGSGSTAILQKKQNKIKGFLVGIDLLGEIWATRNYWASLDIGRKLGSLKKSEGNLINESNSMTVSKYKVKLGYKYLPMGYFYGPQVDGFVGYGNYTYGLDTQVADGFTEFAFKGLLFGARGSMPLQKFFRIHLELSFLLSPGFSEEVTIYGEADSASSYEIELGGSYYYSPNITLDGAFVGSSNTAKFKSSASSVKIKESTFKIGSTFTF